MFARSILTLGTSAFASALTIGAMALSPTPAQAAEEPLFAVLNGNNECNGAGPPAGPICRLGDRDAFGSATILISQAPGGALLCFGITVDNLDAPATAAHIHSGNASFNGPVVVNLAAPVGPAASNPGASSGCVPIAAATASSIVANPTRFYINVHNGPFPGGAVRGQLF
jgi:hypothetical protein